MQWHSQFFELLLCPTTNVCIEKTEMFFFGVGWGGGSKESKVTTLNARKYYSFNDIM
jgi:hypothetical protein